MKLYVYAKPNTMDGYLQNDDCHRFTDDVALCYANSLEEAVEIFCKLYDKELVQGNVEEAWFKVTEYVFVLIFDYTPILSSGNVKKLCRGGGNFPGGHV